MKSRICPVRLPENIDVVLRRMVDETHRTASDILREALVAYLRRWERPFGNHLTDDDRLAHIENLVVHGSHVMSATEVLDKIREMVVVF